MKYIIINEEVETTSGFLTSEAIVRLSSANTNVNVDNNDVVTGNCYAQAVAYKSLEDFTEKNDPITIKGMVMSFQYQDTDCGIDELYTKISDSLAVAGFDNEVLDTI